MIVRLHIEKFALIDHLDLDFSSGLNVLTGETGAGKSIIIDAMGVIIGGMGLQEYIRSGEKKALVEGLFDISDSHLLVERLQELGFTPEEDNTLLLTRELNRSGKNLCRINGRPVTLSMYKEFGELLVDIYGQHHQQSLLHKEKHLLLLDSFGGTTVKEQLTRLKEIATEYNRINKELKELQDNEADKARRLDMYKFQLDEINEANLDSAEEEKLSEERNLLANAEKLMTLAVDVHNYLYLGSSPQSPALDLLHKALNNLKELAEIDGSMKDVASQLQEALYLVEDCAMEIGSYKDNINYDPQRLHQLEDRLEEIKTLKRKYGNTIDEVFAYRDEVAIAADKIQHSEEEIERLKKLRDECRNEYNIEAEKLSKRRKAVAKEIEKEIRRELKDLNMPHVKFIIEFYQRTELSNRGMDDVEFLISPNPGEPPKPLSKIASGGEISRIMLALKTILANVDELPTLIFDEIDAGLGGMTVQSVAEKLALIGNKRQAICVTHSPHIASYADNLFKISKNTVKERTITKLNSLSGKNRVEEIARMLGGQNITKTTIKNATEMLNFAEQRKSRLR